MAILKNVKKIVSKFPYNTAALNKMKEFKEDTECEEYYDGQHTLDLKTLNGKVLAESLGYFIKVDLKKSSDNKMPLGASKLGGMPHLPNDWEWQAGYQFFAQLNVTDFKKHDIENYFPAKGIIYIAREKGRESEDLKILFYDGPYSKLEVRQSVDAGKNISQLSFTPHYTFYIGSCSSETFYTQAIKLIPGELKTQLQKMLGASVTDNDPDWQIFGRPKYWQGEDTYYDEGEDEDDDDWDPVKFGQMMSREENGWKDTSGHLLLFQDQYGEGNRHCWIKPSDLKKKKFDNVIVTYSGT